MINTTGKAVLKQRVSSCPSISLHWDYENVPDPRIDQDLIRFCKFRGNLVTQRAYANRWESTLTVKNGLKSLGLCLISVLIKMKNSADFKCMFDCIEAVQTGPLPDVFVLVAGDGGYAQLIWLLKQWGKQVIVFARRGSESKVIKCLAHEFYFVDELPTLVLKGKSNA